MNDPKIQFVLNYFTRVLNLKKQLEVNYSENESKDSKIWIKNGAGNFFNQEKVYEVDQVSWKKWRGQDLPVLFADEIEKPWFEVENGQVKVQYDLMSSAFYFLSGWDEVYRPVRDAYDRFPYSAGIIARLNIIGLPVVSWYADIIKEAIKYSEYSYELISKNKDPKFHIALTHDIDSLYSGWLQDGWAYIKKGSPQKLVNIISDKVQGYDSWFNLDNISRWETTLDVGASYYFLPQKDRKPGNIPQADYQFNDLNLRNVVKNKLIGRFECGVHGSVGSSRSVDQLQKDMQQIENLTGRQPDGGRFHFLSFDPLSTPEILELSGLTYDSTIGFAEQIGFRRASAHPFYLYDLKNDKATKVVELPLIIMDTTFRQSNYQNVSPENSFNMAKPILEQVKKVKGSAAILWHNTYLTEGKYAGWSAVLESIIEWIKKNNGECVSAIYSLRNYTI